MKKACITFIAIIILLPSFHFGNETKPQIKNKISSLAPELIRIRRHLHMYPELGNREFKTAALVAEKLKELGFSVQENVAVTGVIGILKGGLPGKCVAVRADMDALPITEKAGIPFKSKVDGVMHACGHDIHTTVGLGTAIILAGMKDQIRGTVKFIFQPAEEGNPGEERGGALLMVKEGVLQNPAPEALFGLHVKSGLDVGKLSTKAEGLLASNDQFEIIVKGKGVHASTPWKGVDPVVTAAQVVVALQNIRSRMTDTRIPFVVSVSTIHGGRAFNIIPEEVKLVGTVRTHDQNIRSKIHSLMRQVVEGICTANGAGYEVNINPGAPVTYNHPGLTEWSVGILKDVFGSKNVLPQLPSMGAEDFAWYSQKVPAFFFYVGISNENPETRFPVHNPYFCADERSIPIGVEAMVRLVLDFLESGKKFSL